MHFKDTQEMIRFFRSTPIEPKQYEAPEEKEPEPEKEAKKKGKKNGEVLQTD